MPTASSHILRAVIVTTVGGVASEMSGGGGMAHFSALLETTLFF